MKYNRLGNTDIFISNLSLGAFFSIFDISLINIKKSNNIHNSKNLDLFTRNLAQEKIKMRGNNLWLFERKNWLLRKLIYQDLNPKIRRIFRMCSYRGAFWWSRRYFGIWNFGKCNKKRHQFYWYSLLVCTRTKRRVVRQGIVTITIYLCSNILAINVLKMLDGKIDAFSAYCYIESSHNDHPCFKLQTLQILICLSEKHLRFYSEYHENHILLVQKLGNSN